MAEHKPFIPADVTMRDFNFKTVILGVILGALFGSANAYLGLLVGLTISTAIPLAVISVAILRAFTPVFGRSTILECNISQTTGSASSSLASGLIFTIPALFIWGYEPSLLQMTLLAICGGITGVLFMIPLRGFLIVKEHRNLPYPEGTASAEVLIAASEGGSSAKSIFVGLGIGAVYKSLINLLYLWPSKIQLTLPFIKKAVVGVSTNPALLGVGYILGRRIGTIMVGGGLISWVIIIPIIAHKYGDALIWDNTLAYLRSKGLDPSITTIGELSAKQIWEGYIRIIGAGAVAAAGIITVIRAIPTMAGSLKIGIKELRTSAATLDMGRLRTERDLSLKYVFIGISIVIALVTIIPGIIGTHTFLVMRFLSAVAIALFAFAFVTVSSRIVGMIGVSSNPTSGMAIVTLLGTGLVFKLLGWTDITGKVTALTIGTIVCISASIAGDISQDLKTGFLVGATPRKQQISEIIGALGSAFFVCLAVYYLGKAYGFGSEALPAPQAMLMKTVLDGVLGGDLRWDLVGIGAAFAVIVTFLRIPPLAFAVGMYLPLYSMTPLFIGGMLRHYVEKFYKTNNEEKGKDEGILMGSGFIAGEGMMGVIIAIIAVIMKVEPRFLEIQYPTAWLGQLVAVIPFVALGWFLYRVAARSRAAAARNR
ncbi:MAG: oligopeptide transporter, OPT family [Candidatus Latescibacteria bacterium]|nr:oligopeptide transporter, OPT family [Candidatus Latescibacterota bacterium]NIM21735.1 oligopeptide transporter, OPT family [Candidatus Latescibacterota bacterium]NIM65873.1 oligopeptide transporter, OPT family [Candidatus Latescibacterota bacterium]NIO02618.1 oligopeptide transporter, OPT family [Candidatus Latescibacterota bacterium]NIO29599.1 oligopeptide transporter, OPT family [Candidatus Latescibacterota bacterium]